MNLKCCVVLSLAMVGGAFAELALNDPLPPFSLPGIDGKIHTQDEYTDAEVLALVFTCNHCPTAQAYEQRIEALHRDYRDKGVALVAVSPNDDQAVRLDELGYTDVNDSLEDMKIRAADRGFSFPYLYDGEHQVFSRAVGVKATPQVFLFDRERRLRYVGRIDKDDGAEVQSPDAENALKDLLAGRPVAVPQTRTFGCSTKWSEKRGSVAEADRRWEAKKESLDPVDPDGVRKLVANPGENYLLVNVWATWCGPCVSELPDLVRVQRMYQRRHFRMATISIDKPDRRSQVFNILQQAQASVMQNLLYAGDDLDELADALDASWEGPVPYTLLIAPGGEVLYRKQGTLDLRELRRTIADRLGRTYR